MGYVEVILSVCGLQATSSEEYVRMQELQIGRNQRFKNKTHKTKRDIGSHNDILTYKP